MKRRRLIPMLLLLVAGGAIVNVAVAWGRAMYPPQPSGRDVTVWRAFATGDAGWLVMRRERLGMIRHVAMPRAPRYRYALDSEIAGFYTPWNDGPAMLDERSLQAGSAAAIVADSLGWPMAALSSTYDHGRKEANATVPVEQRWQSAIPMHAAGRSTVTNLDTLRALPLRLRWPGFAINTVFYAVMLWLLFAAPFALRRRRRIKRGLCPKCAYNLRNRPSDSSACPECGTHSAAYVFSNRST